MPIPATFEAEKYTATYDTHVYAVVGYPKQLALDGDTRFMSDQFQRWAGEQGIRLEF